MLILDVCKKNLKKERKKKFASLGKGLFFLSVVVGMVRIFKVCFVHFFFPAKKTLYNNTL